MAKKEEKETKTPKEKKTRDDKLLHGAYKLIVAPPARVLELEPVKYFERVLWESIKVPAGREMSPETFGIASASVKHHRIIHALELHMTESSFDQIELPLEFLGLYDRYLNSLRQDMKTLQAIRIAGRILKKGEEIVVDPLDQLNKAEDKMRLTTEQSIKKRKTSKAEKKKAKSQAKDTEGESPTK